MQFPTAREAAAGAASSQFSDTQQRYVLAGGMLVVTIVLAYIFSKKVLGGLGRVSLLMIKSDSAEKTAVPRLNREYRKIIEDENYKDLCVQFGSTPKNANLKYRHGVGGGSAKETLIGKGLSEKSNSREYVRFPVKLLSLGDENETNPVTCTGGDIFRARGLSKVASAIYSPPFKVGDPILRNSYPHDLRANVNTERQFVVAQPKSKEQRSEQETKYDAQREHAGLGSRLSIGDDDIRNFSQRSGMYGTRRSNTHFADAMVTSAVENLDNEWTESRERKRTIGNTNTDAYLTAFNSESDWERLHGREETPPFSRDYYRETDLDSLENTCFAQNYTEIPSTTQNHVYPHSKGRDDQVFLLRDSDYNADYYGQDNSIRCANQRTTDTTELKYGSSYAVVFKHSQRPLGTAPDKATGNGTELSSDHRGQSTGPTTKANKLGPINEAENIFTTNEYSDRPDGGEEGISSQREYNARARDTFFREKILPLEEASYQYPPANRASEKNRYSAGRPQWAEASERNEGGGGSDARIMKSKHNYYMGVKEAIPPVIKRIEDTIARYDLCKTTNNHLRRLKESTQRKRQHRNIPSAESACEPETVARSNQRSINTLQPLPETTHPSLNHSIPKMKVQAHYSNANVGEKRAPIYPKKEKPYEKQINTAMRRLNSTNCPRCREDQGDSSRLSKVSWQTCEFHSQSDKEVPVSRSRKVNNSDGNSAIAEGERASIANHYSPPQQVVGDRFVGDNSYNFLGKQSRQVTDMKEETTVEFEIPIKETPPKVNIEDNTLLGININDGIIVGLDSAAPIDLIAPNATKELGPTTETPAVGQSSASNQTDLTIVSMAIYDSMEKLPGSSVSDLRGGENAVERSNEEVIVSPLSPVGSDESTSQFHRREDAASSGYSSSIGSDVAVMSKKNSVPLPKQFRARFPSKSMENLAEPPSRRKITNEQCLSKSVEDLTENTKSKLAAASREEKLPIKFPVLSRSMQNVSGDVDSPEKGGYVVTITDVSLNSDDDNNVGAEEANFDVSALSSKPLSRDVSWDDVLEGLLVLSPPESSQSKSENLEKIDVEEITTAAEEGAEGETPVGSESPMGSSRETLNCSSLNLTLQSSEGDLSSSRDTLAQEVTIVKCHYSKCGKGKEVSEAKKSYKMCHNCFTYYCSPECRKNAWPKHKKKCLFSRVNSLCKYVIKHSRSHEETQLAISKMARTGYLSRGRGFVTLVFNSLAAAESFLKSGIEASSHQFYTSLRDVDFEKGDKKLKSLVDLCKNYNPELKCVLKVRIETESESPTKPISRHQGTSFTKCEKIRLSTKLTPSKDLSSIPEEPNTLILTSPRQQSSNESDDKKSRQISFINIQRNLRQKGVSLRLQFPDVYNKLCGWVEDNEPFPPTTIYPRDGRTKRQFMCVLMPNTDPEVLGWATNPDLPKSIDIEAELKQLEANAVAAAERVSSRSSEGDDL